MLSSFVLWTRLLDGVSLMQCSITCCSVTWLAARVTSAEERHARSQECATSSGNLLKINHACWENAWNGEVQSGTGYRLYCFVVVKLFRRFFYLVRRSKFAVFSYCSVAVSAMCWLRRKSCAALPACLPCLTIVMLCTCWPRNLYSHSVWACRWRLLSHFC